MYDSLEFHDLLDVVGFLKYAVSKGASDVHLHIGEHPVIRCDGTIIKTELPILADDDIIEACKVLIPEHMQDGTENNIKDIDFAYEIQGVSRFRINVSRQLGKPAISARVIPYEVKSLGELHMPEHIKQFTGLNNGLVLVTGPTGCGKSTTLTSILEHINITFPKHIITIEDPVEFVFRNKKSIISQRQLFVDTPSYTNGIKYALRQDPDVILIGEIRDRETADSALKAAETGHLVFATLHTNTAVQTVNRIVNMFNPADRPFIRNQLAAVLRGTVSQRLIPLANGSGRRPACEILVVTPTVKDFIEKNELEQIYELVNKGSFNNMVSLNMSLNEMVQSGVITQEDALLASNNRNELKQMLRGVYHGTGLDKK